MIRPAISLLEVRALNCLQNSMMLICAWPRAGPTGGAGEALPASIWSFTDVCLFLGAISSLLCLNLCSCQTLQLLCDLLYLTKLQFDRGGASKNRDHHFQGFAIFVYLVHLAIKVGKRSVCDAYRLVLLELDLD